MNAHSHDVHRRAVYLAQFMQRLSVPSTVKDPYCRAVKIRHSQQCLSRSTLVHPLARIRFEVELEDVDHVWLSTTRMSGLDPSTQLTKVDDVENTPLTALADRREQLAILTGRHSHNSLE